jgi:hypothetical protein
MKRSILFITALIAVFLLKPASVSAQPFDNAGQYMDYIGKANEKLTAIYLSYLSAVAHNKSARKQEKRRNEVVNAIIDTKVDIMALSPWKGDKTYKDTTIAYLKLLNSVFNEDYAKIVNMEEIAEQSYDAMEAYMLAQEKAGEKLDEAAEGQHLKTKEFAKKYNVNLVEGESETSQKSKIASQVIKHNNEVYLVFFKPFKQEGYLLEAFEKKNLNAIEQNINSLEKFANEGLQKLKTIKPYNNDPILINACREALNFYKNEAIQSGKLTDFILKNESFEKKRKAFESLRPKERTQKEVDDFNKAVNEINAAGKEYNNLNNQLNKERAVVVNNWNKQSNNYNDEYMPVQKKQ